MGEECYASDGGARGDLMSTIQGTNFSVTASFLAILTVGT